MEKLKFRTNINCPSCRAAVAPFLDGEVEITSWEVDLGDPERILTVEGEGIAAELVIAALAKAGYKAEPER